MSFTVAGPYTKLVGRTRLTTFIITETNPIPADEWSVEGPDGSELWLIEVDRDTAGASSTVQPKVTTTTPVASAKPRDVVHEAPGAVASYKAQPDARVRVSQAGGQTFYGSSGLDAGATLVVSTVTFRSEV